MRRFVDGNGREWDVFVGRASWGALFALFAPVGHDDAVRQAPLQAGSVEEAEAALDRLAGSALETLLQRSTRKED